MMALLSAINDTEEKNWKLEGCQTCQVLGVDLAMHFFHGWIPLCNVDLLSVQLPYSAFWNLQGWQVTDTGMGLNPQDIPSLFNKFLHADSTTTRNYGGTGLGLAICKRYCHYGQLELLVLVNFVGMLVVCTWLRCLLFAIRLQLRTKTWGKRKLDVFVYKLWNSTISKSF